MRRTAPSRQLMLLSFLCLSLGAVVFFGVSLRLTSRPKSHRTASLASVAPRVPFPESFKKIDSFTPVPIDDPSSKPSNVPHEPKRTPEPSRTPTPFTSPSVEILLLDVESLSGASTRDLDRSLATILTSVKNLETSSVPNLPVRIRVCSMREKGENENMKGSLDLLWVKVDSPPRARGSKEQRRFELWMECLDERELEDSDSDSDSVLVFFDSAVRVSEMWMSWLDGASRWLLFREKGEDCDRIDADVAGFSLERPRQRGIDGKCTLVDVPFSIQKALYGRFTRGLFGIRLNVWREFKKWTTADRDHNVVASEGEVDKGAEKLSWEWYLLSYCAQKKLRFLYEFVPSLGKPETLAIRQDPNEDEDDRMILQEAYNSLLDFSVPKCDLGWDADLSNEDILSCEVLVMTHRMQMIENQGLLPMSTVVNHAFLPMVRSWICNVGNLGVLDRAVFVCVDADCWRALSRDSASKKTDVAWEVVGLFSPKEISGELDFNTAGYYRFMLKRTRFWASVLENDHSFLSFEVDWLWREDVYTAFMTQNVGTLPASQADLIGCTEDSLVNGGFFLIRSTAPGQSLFAKIAEQFTTEVNRFQDTPPNVEVRLDNDQMLLSRLLNSWEKENRIKVSRLPEDFCVSGKFHPKQPGTPWPEKMSLMHNNYVIGMRTKIERATKFGYWFVDSGDSDENWKCVSPEKITRALK